MFPVLEGQSIGVIPPGTDADGKPYQARLYSVSSARDGERPNTNNLALTVKRETDGVCSNYLCDLERGAEVEITGPFGGTFLMPDDPAGQHRHDLHGNRLGAVPRLYRAAAAVDAVRAGRSGALFRRAPAGGAALFRAAEEDTACSS